MRNPGSKALRSLRVKLGLSLRDAAAQIGVSHVVWHQWENGRTPRELFRAELERWSGGAVPASLWRLGKLETRLRARVEAARSASASEVA